jgi:putative flippase GtrA
MKTSDVTMTQKLLPPSADVRAQFFRFAIVGVIGFVVNAGVVAIATSKYGFGPLQAQFIAFPIAVTVTWFLNRQYTFSASRHALHHEWLRYILANSLGWVANNGVYALLVLISVFVYRHPIIAVAAGALSGMMFNFFSSRMLVFQGE